MDILIISASFYPSNSPRAFRTTELVKRFCRLGHNVTLYLPQDKGNLAEFMEEYSIQVKYYNYQEPVFATGRISRICCKLLNIFFEYPDIRIIKKLKNALQNEKKHDLLITIAMPHPIHWAIGLLYKTGKRIAKTWIADCGDPYMLCGTNRWKHPFYFRRLEKLWCRKCDFISVPTKAAKNGYYPEFQDKIRVIPQAFDFNEIKRQEYKKNPIPTFAFSGNLIPHVRDPKPLLDYLLSLDMDFKFIFYSTKRHLIEPYKNQIPQKIEIHDYIPRLDLLYILSGMDFLVNIENTTQIQTPSKLIDYGLVGRPILSFNTQRPDFKVVAEFLKGDYSHQYKILDIDAYNIENVANQFLSLSKISYS
ncbi:glycosyltransferase [Butyricimonas virosa]|uniref:glycosyltransferase n=1 Tax=Butyricimonas virosa TaxID=544645 RepID=UPI0039F49322